MKLIFVIVFLPFTVFCQMHYNLKIEGNDSASIVFARKIRYNDSFSDSLTVMKTLKNISESIRNEGYLTFSIDSLRRDSSTFIARFILGEKWNNGKISLES